jgi:quinol monooxygenase YgiN
MSIYRIGQMKARDGEEEALRQFVEGIIMPGIETSAGNLSCQIYESQEAPGTFMIVEEWENVEAHKASVKNISPDDIQTIMKLLADSPAGNYYSRLH